MIATLHTLPLDDTVVTVISPLHEQHVIAGIFSTDVTRAAQGNTRAYKKGTIEWNQWTGHGIHTFSESDRISQDNQHERDLQRSQLGVMLLIMMNRSLQQPMYLLFFSLSFNDVLGNTVLIPRLMLDVISTDRSISYPACVSQAFFSHTYGTSCHTVMMIMAFDSVAFTYFRILVSCVSRKNKELNRKALQTCATHLVLYMVMLWSGFLIIISHRLQIHNRYRKMAAILFHILPANMNPIIYAMQTKELKTRIVQILHSKVTQLP
ncbi:olfactory receptor 4A8-like isoform X3 [Anguilla rostrata]|uniref:olfactory receptor 4A8-like isoform X3 n=1 Tax=Anguilla rostrata TaxID=7938 RepID=UPI0030D08A38